MEYYTHTYPFHQHYQNMAPHVFEENPAQSFALLSTPIIAIPQPGSIVETKPRLGKGEVEILEREFKKNPKPLTQTKKKIAQDMNVELPRINNWFQNRRAKKKQENKMKDLEQGHSKNSSKNSASSQQASISSDINKENQILNTGIPYSADNIDSPVALCSPKYANTTVITLGPHQPSCTSPHPSSRDETICVKDDSLAPNFMINNGSQPLGASEPITQYIDSLSHEFSNEYDNSALYSSSEQDTSFNASFDTDNQVSNLDSFYSQINAPYQQLPKYPLLTQKICSSSSSSPLDDGLSQISQEFNIATIGDNSSPETRFSQSYNENHLSTLAPPPATSNIPFRSRPPVNIASRRKKVQHRPAALLSHTVNGRSPVGPRTLPHLEGFLPLESPTASPIRRIVSAGGNRAIASGRVQKSGMELAQRSPIKLGGFENFGAIMDRNLQNYYGSFSLNAPPSKSSSLAPSTPLSPVDMASARWEVPLSTNSPVDANANFVFNTKAPGCFVSINEEGLGIASPDTFQSYQSFSTPINKSFDTELDLNENLWLSDAYPEPLYSSIEESFPLDVHSKRSFFSSFSQPVTPAFDSPFSGNFSLSQPSPGLEDSYQYNIAPQLDSEYTLAELYHPKVTSNTNKNQNKTFLFSHTTPADFSQK